MASKSISSSRNVSTSTQNKKKSVKSECDLKESFTHLNINSEINRIDLDLVESLKPNSSSDSESLSKIHERINPPEVQDDTISDELKIGAAKLVSGYVCVPGDQENFNKHFKNFDYVFGRIKKYSGLRQCELVLSISYFNEICVSDVEFICGVNIINLLVACVLLANKVSNDRPIRNRWWGSLFNMSAKEITVMEAHALRILDFHLEVTPKSYQNILKQISITEKK